MKKAALLIVVIVVVAFLALWTDGTMRAHRQASNQAWPANLGTLDDVPKHFPPAEQSAEATALVRLADAAKINIQPLSRDSSMRRAAMADMALRKALGTYVQSQLERSGDAIDAPPPAVAEYLTANEFALDEVRNHLLNGQPVVWETKVKEGFNAPIPNLSGHMTIQRVLVARALDKARRNDPSAWEELHASWQLSRALWRRPDSVAILIALASTRMSNAAARKMPLPVPSWFRETQTYDYLGAVAATQQVEAWTIHATKSRRRTIEDYLRAPLWAYQEAQAIRLLREHAKYAISSNACDADDRQLAVESSISAFNVAMPNITAIWKRVMRFRAELEATERVLQIRAGQPPSPKSTCSDGSWNVTAHSIKFTRDLKLPSYAMNVPLEYAR